MDLFESNFIYVFSTQNVSKKRRSPREMMDIKRKSTFRNAIRNEPGVNWKKAAVAVRTPIRIKQRRQASKGIGKGAIAGAAIGAASQTANEIIYGVAGKEIIKY